MNAHGQQQPSGLPCATPAATVAVAAARPSPGYRDADLPPLPCNVDRQSRSSKSQKPRFVRARSALPGQDERPRPGRRRLQLLQQEPDSSPSLSTPRPRMQRSRNARLPSLYFSTLILVLALCCGCCHPVTAAIMTSDITIDAAMSSALASLERAGQILVDTRPPPNVAELRRRDDVSTTQDSTSSATTTPSSTSAASATNSTSTSASPSSTSIATDPNAPSGDSLPTPFDSGIGTNYTTSSCPTFFKSFLSSSTFKSCLPFSLLLQNSQSFFQAEKSIVLVTQALDAACRVNLKECVNTMSGLAQNLKLNSNCGDDLKAQNPLVVQAYQGLLAYEPLYRAGCATAPSTGSYCFANAITNTTSTADSYVYFLPLGIPLPGGARPTCNSCLQDTMSIFSGFAGNTTQPLSTTYVRAAQQINIGCGPNFVNTSATHVSQSSPAPRPPPSLIYLAFATLLLRTFLFH